MREDLVRESVEQMAGAWRAMAAPIEGALLVDDGPLSVSIGKVPLFILNTIVLQDRVGEQELPKLVAKSKDYGAECPAPWLLMTCDEWLPESGAATMGQSGLVAGMKATGMVAERLVAPRRPGPEELEIRTKVDETIVRAMFDVNCESYGIPLEQGLASIRPGMFENGVWCATGWIGGHPVSVAAVYLVGDCLYVAWVATAPGSRRRGYAETVMRRALADASAATGITRTTLHASVAGRPIYEAMGYERVAEFTMFVGGAGEQSH
jgi:GNAT superfamily N-acetyltransferase